MLRSFARILFILAVYAATAHAQTESDILDNFNKIFPGRSAVFDSLKARDLGDIIRHQVSSSYAIGSIRTQIQKYDLQLSLSDETYKPVFNLSAGLQGYRSYDRLVDVNARVPVEWDNRNPIKSDYRLPNGGRGVMWIPQPLRWEEREIELHASTDYRDFLQSYSMGFNYRTSYGLSINALNLSLKNRVLPQAYGYPWSAILSNSFELPLFKNAGQEGSSVENEKKITKISIDIAKTNSQIAVNSISYETIKNYFKIYFLWNKLKLIHEMIALTEVQLQDQQVLTAKNLISVYDRLRIEKEHRQMLSDKDQMLFDYISLSAKLNPASVVNSQDMYLFIPQIDSVHTYLEAFEKFLVNNCLQDGTDKIIDMHPEIEISRKSLEQAKVNLAYSLNQYKPDISLTGNMAVFESDELGYSTITNSLGNLFRKPDGIAWNVGFNYRFSLFSSPSGIQRQIAIEDYEQQEQNLKSTKENINLQVNEFLFKLKSSNISLNSARNNLSYANKIMKEGEELFKIQRISRFDYSEYKKTGLSETMAILNVYDSQIDLLIQFMQYLGIKPRTALEIINNTDNQKAEHALFDK
ncbi:MAG: TolC family protein [Ignavibacteria bacterium]|jgi:outer membrane protein TolC|nr:TolC family protein [Ignavibacteria bacterium]MCU7502878.1 TolC family protein [Ignavibacteria bacterium]MCU7515628.1 TolC family protein [Ignavibacteria bacterium]